MKILESLRNEIVNFYDFDEDKRNLIIGKLVEIIGSADKDILIKEIREDFAQHKNSGIGVIYEAITHHADSWTDFIVNEYKRAFELALKSDNPSDILECLDEFCFVKDKKNDLGKKIVSILEHNLSAEKYEVRRSAVLLSGDWITDDNKSKYQSTVYKIQEKLSDNNWKVRYIAELTLTGINSLPVGFSRSFVDKLRLYFGDAFN